MLLGSPDAPDVADAVRVGDAALSRADLFGAAGALADRLAGARSVALTATPSLPTVVAVVAGLLAGVPVVPIPADAGPAEREHILRDSAAEVVLPDPLELPTERSFGSHPEPAPDRTALILYTSGTTGPPKGAVLSRGAIAADLDALAAAWAWTPDDTLVHGLPLFHVHGLVLGVLGALRVGGRLVHTVRPAPAAYAAAGGTLYFGVPTVWSRIAGDPAAARALRPARLLVSGSAPLAERTFGGLAALAGHRPVERYGMTETLITLSTRPDGPREPGYVGLPVGPVEARLVDESGAAVPADDATIGRLQVRGPTLFDGYLGRADATAGATTADGWFRTGDVACRHPDRGYRIVGRESTDLIKTGGYRVGAGEVEDALVAHPAVAEAAVVGEPDDDLGQRIVAYCVADGVDEPAVIDFVAGRLSVHKRPRRVVFVTELPRNALGKVQKTRLADGPAP